MKPTSGWVGYIYFLNPFYKRNLFLKAYLLLFKVCNHKSCYQLSTFYFFSKTGNEGLGIIKFHERNRGCLLFLKKKKRIMERSKYTCTNVNHCRKKVTACITKLSRAIVFVLVIKYDARAAEIKQSVILCFF